MSNIIDILVVVDAATLATTKPGGTANNPINLGAWGTSDPYIYMITQGCFVVSNQAQSELNVQAMSGDNIRWTITAPGSGVTYNPILYSFGTNNNNAMTPPQMLNITVNEYMPANTQNPTGGLKVVPYQDYVWQATLLEPKVSIQYTWSFMIADSTGNVLGYYVWDPFITVG